MTQLLLPLRMTPAQLLAAALARTMLCVRYHERLSQDVCAARQLGRASVTSGGAKRPMRAPPPHCASGQCRQGEDVLASLGLVVRTDCPDCCACPTCGGRHWVHREVEPMATGRGG